MNSILFISGTVVLLLPLLKVSLNNTFWQAIIHGSHQNPSGNGYGHDRTKLSYKIG